jgi:hypothetical protein
VGFDGLTLKTASFIGFQRSATGNIVIRRKTVLNTFTVVLCYYAASFFQGNYEEFILSALF